ncbi:MAG: hypothetical protein JKY33_06870 [Bacteroidia bacterium]|nr:hypothetical protein [Bacteroidia bacterium]
MISFKKKKKDTKSLARSFVSVLNGNFLTRENAVQRLPFLFFLTLLMICYIANTHYAEKTVRETDKLNRQLKELSSEYITTKSDLMFKSKQSEVAKAVEQMGIKESIVPPKKITMGRSNGN